MVYHLQVNSNHAVNHRHSVQVGRCFRISQVAPSYFNSNTASLLSKRVSIAFSAPEHNKPSATSRICPAADGVIRNESDIGTSTEVTLVYYEAQFANSMDMLYPQCYVLLL